MERPSDPKEARFDGTEQGIVALITALDARTRSGQTVTLGDALDLSGTRIHGIAILLLALPEAIPLPIPSVGALLAVPLFIISSHLAVFGEHGRFPQRLRQTVISERIIAIMVRFLVAPLRLVERLSRERLSFIVRREKLVGLLCLLSSVLLLLPIPFMNMPPALAMAFMAWGLVRRDGLFVGVGIAICGGTVIGLVVATDLIVKALGI